MLYRRTSSAARSGVNTLGFRMYCEEKGDNRFVKQTVEIEAPGLGFAA